MAPVALPRTPRVSIVIVGYDSLEYLTNCLSSVLKSRYSNFEVIYVDNGSTDASARYFDTHAGKTGRTIRLDRNYGFTTANNIGAKAATGEYIVFLNVDTIVDSEWLEQLVTTLENAPDVGAAQALLLQLGSDLIDSLGEFITPYGTVYSRGYGEPASTFSTPQEAFYSKGAAMITRSYLWRTVGGFDPVFHLYYQETDYCWKLWAMGCRVICVPGSKVWHVGGAVSSRRPSLIKYYEARERLVLLLKNYSAHSLVKYVPITVCLQFANAVKFLFRGDPTNAANITRGTISALIHTRVIWKRRRFFSARGVAEDYIIRKLMVPNIARTL